jgi:hypothetical protein
MWAPLFHRVAARVVSRHYRRFRHALDQPEAAQREALARVLGFLEPATLARGAGLGRDTTYEQFASRMPACSYSHLEGLIAEQRLRVERSLIAPGPVRFIPTSGSTSTRKWIPATVASGREFDAAAGAWMTDVAREDRSILDGRHYWSLSWLPDEMRREPGCNDDLEFLPPLHRWLLKRTMTVPADVASLSTAAASRRATVVHLAACQDLRLISVWSPTFMLALLDELERAREPIADALGRGPWAPAWSAEFGPHPPGVAPRSARAARILRDADSELEPSVLAALWPRLGLLSAWDSATSSGFAASLRARMPGVPFQGKGLWATEGVVTIPFQGSYPAAITSHFLEFRCLDSGRIHPVWQLRTGQRVQPILTTGAGLLRYELDDEMRVTGRLGRTPCLRFEGRLGGLDLVGEKLTRQLARSALRDLESRLGVRALCLVALVPTDSTTPRYVLLAEPDQEPLGHPEAHEVVERRLRQVHHYALARDAGQLEGARAVIRTDARDIYARIRAASGVPEGAVKPEPLLMLTRSRALEGCLDQGDQRSGSGGERQCASY